MDKYVTYQGMDFLPAHFTCAATGVKLTLKTVTSHVDAEGKKDVYQIGKAPVVAPTPTKDMNDARVTSVPDSNFNSNARMLNYAGKGAERGSNAPDIGSNYGLDAVSVKTQTSVPDSVMRTSDRKFMIAGRNDTRDSKDQTSTSQYGPGAVALETIANTEKPPTTVQNVNLMEKRHNGTTTYKNA